MYLQFVPILICGEKSMSFILVDGGSGVLREIREQVAALRLSRSQRASGQKPCHMLSRLMVKIYFWA